MIIDALTQQPRIRSALTAFTRTAQLEQLITSAIAVQQIPAPTFDEGQRARYVERQFAQLGLHDVSRDEIENVYGRFVGKQSDLPPVVVSAHSDTVFALDTDLTVTRENGRVYGPGIADNSTGVAGLFALIKMFATFGLQPDRDVWFVVNVGEEGLGNLSGMRVVTDRFATAEAFIVVEGGMYGYVLHEAIGVRRYRVTVETEGGHSWSDFGRISAIHVLSQIIAKIDKIRVPEKPKTTYNVGVISGGTSINTIASSASFQLDLRSEDPNGLTFLVDQFDKIIRWSDERYEATIHVDEIGNRPAGEIPRESILVQHAINALRVVGCTDIQYLRGSTDANIPLSRGLSAVCIGLAHSANAHRTDEYLDTRDLARGMQQLLLLTLAAASA